MKKIRLTLALVVFTTFISCSTFQKSSTSTTNETGSITDPRDGRKYATVKIGEQWWMAENLDFNCEGSSYYKESPRFSAFYGRLYTWDAAQNACPSGWRLPSDEDWKKLEMTLGLPERMLDETDFRGSDQGKQLLVKGTTGFNAMLGGYKTIEGNYDEMDGVGSYWTSSQLNKFDGWGRGFQFDNPQISRRGFAKAYAFSVRCIKE